MTSRLERQITIACPHGQATNRLDRIVRSHVDAAGACTLVLGFGSSDGASVVASVHAVHRAGDREPRYRVEWASHAGAHVPMFAGELRVENHDEYGSFTLILRGEYEPAFGQVGPRFDATLGKEIASATASDLLQRASSFVMEDYRADEARLQERIRESRVIDLGAARNRKAAAS